MKILLSAYACEPNRGSEPGVGWNWAREIASRGHKVWVVTRRNNKVAIENENYDKTNLVFIYFDLPTPILKLKKILGVNLYYILWQIGVAIFLKLHFEKIRFDLVHHITFGVFRNISYIPFLIKAPLIFGPVGGGETTPISLKQSFSRKNRLKEKFRETLNHLTFYSPLYRHFLSKSTFIFCKTKETLNLIPSKFQHKARIELEIGIDGDMGSSTELPANRDARILFVGRFVYWKGAHLSLKAFSMLQKRLPNAKMVMIGKGEELDTLKTIQKDQRIKNVDWIDWINQQELSKYYQNSDVMLFPSLHDSSGNVVLEALSHSLPVVCLNLGGPPEIIGKKLDTIVETNGKTEDEVVNLLCDKLYHIITHTEHYSNLRAQALLRSSELTWKSTVDKIYSTIEERLLPNLSNSSIV
jgi:glycosyltransferase involved in cell wall biosynthesis